MGKGRDLQPRKRRNPPDVAGRPPPDPGAGADPDYSQSRTIREREDARFRKIKADQAQLDLDLAKGKVHSLEQCEELQVRKIAVVKRKLLGLGRELAPHLAGLDPRQIQAAIDKRTAEIVQSFADGR